MMRIGILTFHRSLNNGAFVQCYSLYKRLKKEFPDAEVEVIDYTSPKIEQLYPVSIAQYFRGYMQPRAFLSRAKRFLKDPGVIRRNREKKVAFESCYKKITMSDRRFYHEPLRELYTYINSRYDAVVCGSDAIWNYSLRGFPNPYFLDTSVTIPKYTYAASCFGMNYEKIPDSEKKSIKLILDSYQFLGVRDDESAKFLKSIGCSNSYKHTCDPTVFLDVNDLPVNEKALYNKLSASGFSTERKTIGVMGTNQMCQLVKQMYGDEYQVVSLFNYCKDADVNLYNITPFEWAYVFRLFKVTITTYFHGTLLSLRNGVPVVCIALEDEFTSKHESKVEDFLKRVELSDCYFHLSDIMSNIEKTRTRIDDLLSGRLSSFILEKMDAEARTSDYFISRFKNND